MEAGFIYWEIGSSPDVLLLEMLYSKLALNESQTLQEKTKFRFKRSYKMSAEQNKSVVRRWVEEGWNKGNLTVVDQIYTPDFVQHEPAPERVNSSEALKQYVRGYLTAFPDLHFHIEDLVADGEKVVWRFSSTGTHKGDFMGIPPTGKIGYVTGMVMFRLENSRIAEAWVNIDALGLLQQLGVIPVP
jgi:steroid delta-isomerase-like uncharacterized protein